MSADLTRTHFWKRGQQRGTASLFFLGNSGLRAPTPFEICGSVEVFRSSIIVFLNLAECDMQCSVKVTGVFIGTRTCKCIERYKRSNCSNKGNNIWTCTSPCEHCAASICCAPLVKEGGQGISRSHLQNKQN